VKQIQILLTNDDGIQSPGLWTAASALSGLGFVHVVAPRDQFSGAGRSMPISSDGLITVPDRVVKEQSWKVYSVGGTPAQAVQHAVLEVLPVRPDLVVSGINYGRIWAPVSPFLVRLGQPWKPPRWVCQRWRSR
jgi:5'-nucleotidase